MLIRYKRMFEKIAMGLMSFMPQEKDLKKLQETIKQYETNENWHLYLWKEDEDIVGIIGIAIEDEQTAILQHVSVNPSYRNQGLGKKMVSELNKRIGEKFEIIPNKHTRAFYEKCL
mgnify:FL=1